jgi:hypothetical protein
MSSGTVFSNVKSHLVAEALGSDDSDLITDTLVGLEVECELGIVALNDDLSGLLDGLGTNATHFGGIRLVRTLGEVARSRCCEISYRLNFGVQKVGGATKSPLSRENFCINFMPLT